MKPTVSILRQEERLINSDLAWRSTRAFPSLQDLLWKSVATTMILGTANSLQKRAMQVMTRHQVLMTTALTIETITASKRHLEGQGSCLMRAAFLRSGFVRGTHV